MTDKSSSMPSSTPTSPREELNESLSALVDGEQNDIDLQRVLKNLDADASGDALRESWSRYHMVSALMRKEAGHYAHVDMSASISAAIAAESTPELSTGKKRSLNSGQASGASVWWSGIGKTAVAASVMLGVVFAAQQFTSVGPADDAAVVANQDAAVSSGAELSGAVVPKGFELPPLAAQTVSASSYSPQQSAARVALPNSAVQGAIVISGEEFREQMNRLMYKHAEQVSSASALGLIPYARVAEARSLDDVNKQMKSKQPQTNPSVKSGIDSQNEVVKEAQ